MKTNTPGNGMKREGTESRGCSVESRWKPELCDYARWKKAMHDPMVLGGRAALDNEIVEVLADAVYDVRACAHEYVCNDDDADEYDRRIFRIERILEYMLTTPILEQQMTMEEFYELQ